MFRQKPRNRWVGIVAGLLFFAFPGLPYFLLSLMGDRVCDTGGPEPCTMSREMADLQVFAVVVVASILVGLLAHWVANRPRRPKPSLNAFD